MIPMAPDGFRRYSERGSKRTSVDLPLVCANGPRDQPCSYPGASPRGDCRPITARMSTAGSRGPLGTPTSRSAPPVSAVFVPGRVPAGGACSAWRQGHRSASRSNPRVGVRALAGFARIMPRSDSPSCLDPAPIMPRSAARIPSVEFPIRAYRQHRTQFRKSRCFSRLCRFQTVCRRFRLVSGNPVPGTGGVVSRVPDP